MKYISLYVILIIGSLEIFSCRAQVTENNRVREPAVAGSFYPSDAEGLNAELYMLFDKAEDKAVDGNIAAIIVPHAGYIFSGQVAASAYAKIDPNHSYSRIFVMGTSHHVYLNGASIYNLGDYKTPLGTVPVDRELVAQLINDHQEIEYVPGAHTQEHCIEVQLPFLQYHLKKPFRIVPIIIGTNNTGTCKNLARILEPWFTPENLFVISTDFSHYPAYDDAVKNDRTTGFAVAGNSPASFLNAIRTNEQKKIPGLVTSCCGWSSVLTLLDITSEQNDIRINHVKYMNSGDTPYGEKDRVVGYHAFTFTRDTTNDPEDAYIFSPEEKRILLKIARESITSELEHSQLPGVREDELPDNLKSNCGAFVTLTKKGRLRGCIGRFISNEPLYQVVQDMAVSAAFQDPRFTPVVNHEMQDIDIEISVLTPLKEIHSVDEFVLGKQGIYMIKEGRSGTFLPQVAESTHWSKEEFLGHCARDKAGIGWDGWKDAKLYTYEALVFDEGQFEK